MTETTENVKPERPTIEFGMSQLRICFDCATRLVSRDRLRKPSRGPQRPTLFRYLTELNVASIIVFNPNSPGALRKEEIGFKSNQYTGWAFQVFLVFFFLINYIVSKQASSYSAMYVACHATIPKKIIKNCFFEKFKSYIDITAAVVAVAG